MYGLMTERQTVPALCFPNTDSCKFEQLQTATNTHVINSSQLLSLTLHLNSIPSFRYLTQEAKEQQTTRDTMNQVGTVAVIHPNVLDILCGSGELVRTHPGNIRFRTTLDQHYNDYSLAKSKIQKMIVARRVMHDLMSSGSTRFLKKDPIFERFYVVTIRAAKDKVSHCLREMKIGKGRRRCRRVCQDLRHNFKKDFMDLQNFGPYALAPSIVTQGTNASGEQFCVETERTWLISLESSLMASSDMLAQAAVVSQPPPARNYLQQFDPVERLLPTPTSSHQSYRRNTSTSPSNNERLTFSLPDISDSPGEVQQNSTSNKDEFAPTNIFRPQDHQVPQDRPPSTHSRNIALHYPASQSFYF